MLDVGHTCFLIYIFEGKIILTMYRIAGASESKLIRDDMAIFNCLPPERIEGAAVVVMKKEAKVGYRVERNSN